MIKRRKPIKRSTKPIRRTPIRCARNRHRLTRSTIRYNPRDRYLRAADGLWGLLVHALGKHRCAVGIGCEGPLEAHHLVTKGVTHHRHDPANGILLCRAHHQGSVLSPHGAPRAWLHWLEHARPEAAVFVRAHKHYRFAPVIAPKVDYRETCERLQSELDKA